MMDTPVTREVRFGKRRRTPPERRLNSTFHPFAEGKDSLSTSIRDRANVVGRDIISADSSQKRFSLVDIASKRILRPSSLALEKISRMSAGRPSRISISKTSRDAIIERERKRKSDAKVTFFVRYQCTLL